MIFVGWVFLWESQAAHLPNLLGKDLKVILPTLLMGLLGTELTKWDSHSPLSFFFFSQLPSSSSISQKMLHFPFYLFAF